MHDTFKKPLSLILALLTIGVVLLTYGTLVQASTATVDFLIVAGGAGGAGGDSSNVAGGGGGGGGVISSSTDVTVDTYSVVVGAGGVVRSNGTSSSVFSETAVGGGTGGNANTAGTAGGSGGGGGGGNVDIFPAGGAGTSGQGYSGGAGAGASSNASRRAGGGGGAGGVGGDAATGGQAGNGGAGILSSISGSSVYYGAGGGGGSRGTTDNGTGGTGGGGDGAVNNGVAGNGTGPGAGGGGSAGSTGTPGTGADGIVIIAYETGTLTATGGTITTSGTTTIHTFTSNGTFEVTAVGAGDTDPPTPDPMTFATLPDPVSTSSVTMIATTATDASSPVEYYVEYVACSTHAGAGASDSGWQVSTTYTDTGLEVNQCYGYRVAARDALGNTTASSSVSEAYTLAEVPGQPTLADQSTSSIKVTNNQNGNPAHTTFAVQILNTAPNDATWEGQYVDSDGTPSPTEVWLTDAEIDGLTIVNLTSDTYYEARVKARNGDSVETAFSAVDALETNDGEATRSPDDPVQVWTRGGTIIRGGVRFGPGDP